MLGQALLLACVGVLAGRLTLEAVGPALLGAALLLLGLYEVLVRRRAEKVEEPV